MLDVLKLVRGAVSKKDMLPVLTHFYIYDGRIQGSNGRLCIDAACPDLNICNIVVPATEFLKAVDTCDGEPNLVVTESKLTIKKGRFKSVLSTLPEDSYPAIKEFDGVAATITGEIIPALKRLAPFISTDASRPWSNTVLIWEGHGYATNNVVVTRSEIPISSILVLPVYLVAEMVRIGKEPLSIKVTRNGVVVEYDTFRIKGIAILDQWPASLIRLRDAMINSDPQPVMEGLYDSVLKLKPFFPDEKLPVIMLSPEGIGTRDGVRSALIEIDGLPEGMYRYESLLSVLEIATHIDFNQYPNAVPFKGEGIQGLLTVMRK